MKTRCIGITLGDVNGVGPEVALKAANRRWPGGTRIVLIGSASSVGQTCSNLGLAAPPPWSPEDSAAPRQKITHWNPSPELDPAIRPGNITAEAGRASHAWICAAIDACLDRTLDAMVTAPICKAAMQRAGFTTPGHTELLAERTGTRRYGMMLFGGGLRVVLVTRHIPLRDVADTLTARELREAATLTAEALPWLGIRKGTIAVCGLNPHAGEHGAMGTEEIKLIGPAVRRLQRKGMKIDGPLPADTLFHRALRGDFDAVLAMYHDQGLAPMKMIGFDEGVNLTLGLPIVRTSPDHGTAFSIAGKGVASASSMVEAIRTAILLAGKPNPWRRKTKR